MSILFISRVGTAAGTGRAWVLSLVWVIDEVPPQVCPGGYAAEGYRGEQGIAVRVV